MAITYRDELTPREREEMDYSREENERNRQYNLEIAKVENSWTQLFRLPLAILSLPVKVVVALAIIPYAIKGSDIPENLWKALKF